MPISEIVLCTSYVPRGQDSLPEAVKIRQGEHPKLAGRLSVRQTPDLMRLDTVLPPSPAMVPEFLSDTVRRGARIVAWASQAIDWSVQRVDALLEALLYQADSFQAAPLRVEPVAAGQEALLGSLIYSGDIAQRFFDQQRALFQGLPSLPFVTQRLRELCSGFPRPGLTPESLLQPRSTFTELLGPELCRRNVFCPGMLHGPYLNDRDRICTHLDFRAWRLGSDWLASGFPLGHQGILPLVILDGLTALPREVERQVDQCLRTKTPLPFAIQCLRGIPPGVPTGSLCWLASADPLMTLYSSRHSFMVPWVRPDSLVSRYLPGRGALEKPEGVQNLMAYRPLALTDYGLAGPGDDQLPGPSPLWAALAAAQRHGRPLVTVYTNSLHAYDDAADFWKETLPLQWCRNAPS